jgi:hypothetical protein
MSREPVKSGNIRSVGHDPATNTLEVEFHGGKVYRYRGVTAHQHRELMRADSLGRHFHENLRHLRAEEL